MAERQLKVTAIFDDQLTGQLSAVGKTAGAALSGGLLAGGAALAAGVGAAVKASSDFNATLSGIAAVGGPAAAASMDDLRAKALQLGKDTAFSAGEAASAMEELAKKGVSTADMLGGAADAAVSLAAAGSIALPEAAAITATAMNQFGLAGAELPHVADLLAGASSSAGVSVTALGESLNYVGPVSKSLGQSLDDTTTAVAILGKQGIVGSSAGTALRASMLALASPSKDAAGAMQALGINVFDAKGKMMAMPALFEHLRQKTAGLSDQAKADTFTKIFGREAVSSVNALVSAGGPGFESMATAMGKLSASAVAAERLNNLKGDVMALGGSLETVAIVVGSALEPAIRAGVASVTGFVNNLLPMADAFGKAFGPAFALFQTALGQIGLGLSKLAAFLAPVLIPILGLMALTIGVGVVAALYSATTSALSFAAALTIGGVVAIGQFTLSLVTGAIMGLLSFVGTMVTTVIPGIIGFGTVLMTQGLGSALLFAGGLITGPIASVLTFAGVLITQGIGAAVAYGISLLSMSSASAAAGASFFVGLIPGALAAAAAFFTTTIPSVVATGAAFVMGLIPALAATVVSVAATALGFLAGLVPALVAANASLVATIAGAITTAATFLTTTLPAIIATAAGFLATLVPAVWVAVTSFLAGIIPAAIAVVGGLLAMIPAAIAAAGGFLSLAATAALGLAGVVASAIAAGIGVIIGLWPIILVAGLIGLAVYMVYKNWDSIWRAIVKFTGTVGKTIWKLITSMVKGMADIVKKGLSFIGKAFKSIFGGILKIGKEFVTKFAGGIRKGISGMATKVLDTLSKLARKIWDGMKGIVTIIVNMLKAIPGVEQIIEGIANAGSSIGNFIDGFKSSFNDAGGDAGGGFVDNLVGAIDDGLASAGLDFSVKDTLDGMMPEMPGAAAGGGGGAAGGAAADPTGIWSGTDGKGAWTIDPATGQKIYEAGSVGAIGQENAAAKKAASEAGKQARDGAGGKSGVGAAIEKNLAPKESIDLAKAFSEAVQGSIAAMAELIGARIPSPDQYMPKLEQVRQFWLDVGNMFADIYRYAAVTERGKAPGGALIKSDLEGIGIGADSMDKVFKSLESVTGFMTKLADMKKLPTMEGLAVVKTFALAAVGIGREIMGLLDKAAAEVLAPVADALGKVVDVLGKTADLMTKPMKGAAPSEAARGAMVETLRWIGGFAYELTAPLMERADESIAALKMSEDVMKTLGAGVDMIAKVVTLLGSGASKVKAMAEGAKPALEDAIRWIGGLAYTFTAGLMADSERNQVQLNLAKEVFASLGSGMDMVTKAVALLTGNVTKLTALPRPAMDLVQEAIAWVGALAWQITGPLLKDVDASLESLKVGKEAMSALSVGLDLFAKAASLKVRAVQIADDALAIVADNITRIVGSLSGIALGFFDADGTLKQAIANLKPFSDSVGVAVDLFGKVAGLKFDGAARLTADVLAIVEQNTMDIVSTVAGLAFIWTNVDGEFPPIVLGIKSFVEQASAAVDLFVKAATIGTDWEGATLITGWAIVKVNLNMMAIMGAIRGMAESFSDPDGVMLPIVAGIKAFSDAAGDAVELFEKAAGIGVEWDKSTLITSKVLSNVNMNLMNIMTTLAAHAAGWMDADGALQKVITNIKAFADNAGAAVGLFVEAAGLSVDWAKVSVIPADKLDIVNQNIAAVLDHIKTQLVLWTLADGELDPVLAKIKEYAESSSAAVELVTKGAGLGAELADTVLVTADMLKVAGQNIKLALDEVMNLATGFDGLEATIREELFAKIKSYSESASTAVELILKGAGLSEALQNVKPIGRKVFEMVAEQIKFSIEELARLMKQVGPDVVDDARKIAESAGPVADAIGKALDAFSLEKMLASGFIDAKVRSGPAAKAAQTRMQTFANSVKAGIKLMFDTLRDAMGSIGGVDAGMAAHIQNLVSAYTPIITLIERLSALKWDMRKIREFATIPGLLGWGIAGGMGGAGGAQGGGGTGGPGGSGPGGGILLTGPATITGPVTFQGQMQVNVSLDGSVIQSTVTSGTYNRARKRHAQTGATA